ncbi:uncharacterized protein [Physcomitrium patens]|uniref:uncharacterized protein n=1 Tax=Physcomitrium patens TaxID=3218 RepID=UPI003CCD7000
MRTAGSRLHFIIIVIIIILILLLPCFVPIPHCCIDIVTVVAWGGRGGGGGGVGAHPPLWTGPLLPHNAIATEILDGSYDCRGAAATRLWRASLSCGGGARTGLHRAPGSVWSVVGQAVIVRCDLEGVRREIMDWRKAPGKESLTSRTGATHEGQVSELPRQICGASLIHPSAHPPKGQLIWGVARKHGHSIVRGGPFIWPRLSLLLGAPLQMPPPASSIITIVFLKHSQKCMQDTLLGPLHDSPILIHF